MKETFNLSDADRMGNAVKVSCHLCRGPRYYRPADLIKIFGDIACWDVQSKMRCEWCGQKEYLTVRIETLIGEQLGKARFRRLKGIKILRRPIWEDER